jgi:hypothetical protein
MGLAMENFDTASEFRTTENGALIDASGDLNGQKFDGIPQLAQVLKDNPATTACLITRTFSYGKESMPTADERTWLASLQSDLTKDGVKWRELMRRITLNPDFYTNPVAASPAKPPLSAQAGE